MATSPFPTIGDLFRAREVTDEDLNAVASGWLEDRIEGPVPIGQHAVDVASAVEAHKPSRVALDDDEAHADHRVAAIREAIILAPALRA